uniref:Uncharacterized protein n=1 Tax=Phlebotomus papatasi TaxID=29031 RepID=A0A1B0DF88_PHLPP
MIGRVATGAVCHEGRAPNNYEIKISSNTPAVLGSQVIFKADFYTDGKLVEGNYKFYWEDNANHRSVNQSSQPQSEWTVSYPSDRYPPGNYEVQVEVQKWEFVLYITVASARLQFNVT